MQRIKSVAGIIWIIVAWLSSVGLAAETSRPAVPPSNACVAAAKVLWLQTQFPGVETASVITVKAPPACAWTVQSKAPWIKFHRTEFRGYAVFSFKVEPNAQALRTGEIELAGQTFTLTQNKLLASTAAVSTKANSESNRAGSGGVAPSYGSGGNYGSNGGSDSGGNQLSSGASFGGAGNGSNSGAGPAMMPVTLPHLTNGGTPALQWMNIEDSGAASTIVVAKDQLYQLRKNGTVLHYKGEEKWEVIDTDPNIRTLVAWQNRLYQWCLNQGVSVWSENAKSWSVVDAEAKTLVVTADHLYTLRPVGLWQYNGKTWNLIEAGFTTLSIATTNDHLYQLRDKQGVWKYDEAQRTWMQIDTTVEIKTLTTHGRNLYQTRLDGSVYWYMGMNWQIVQGKIPTKMIVATEKAFYHLDENGQIWKAVIN